MAETGLVSDGCGLNVEGPIGVGVQPEAGSWRIGLKGIVMALVKAALARLQDPVDNGDAEGEFDEAVLHGAVGHVWGEVGADLDNVMASEGITGGEAHWGIREVLAEDQDALTNVDADELKDALDVVLDAWPRKPFQVSSSVMAVPSGCAVTLGLTILGMYKVQTLFPIK
jgi:hypothetical protein